MTTSVKREDAAEWGAERSGREAHARLVGDAGLGMLSDAVGAVLVNDAAQVYWIDPRSATVLQFPKTGGASTTPVAFQLASATDPRLALDGLSVDSGAEGGSNGHPD